MKTPDELARKLARQWENPDLREARLLGDTDAWPICLAIGRPLGRALKSDLDSVRIHIRRWRKVRTGTVIWDSSAYRAAAERVEIPVRWEIQNPAEWADACGDRMVRSEFETLSRLIEHTDRLFHPSLVRRRSLWRGRAGGEVVQAAQLALLLEPSCAKGKPLRTLSAAGIDTKFFERNERLITALLDVRFEGEPGKLGLESFLGALAERDHWLLVRDLGGGLLPFEMLRVRASELRETALPAERILIIENENCHHQLPNLPGCIAVLGSGFDLTWTTGVWLQNKIVAYWGDIDTWGLSFLAKARANIPPLTALMMDRQVFTDHATAAVSEPVIADLTPPANLAPDEQSLYKWLTHLERGRLEQEFVQSSVIHRKVIGWYQSKPEVTPSDLDRQSRF
jgi:hypothetical protein